MCEKDEEIKKKSNSKGGRYASEREGEREGGLSACKASAT